MSTRDELVSRLLYSLLGPMSGVHEILQQDHNPRSEYITGVLAPRVLGTTDATQATRDPDSEADLLDTEMSGADDEDDQDVALTPPVFSPSLDPRALPCSIGLTFVLECDEIPQFSICATYARYTEQSDQTWLRKPECLLTGFIAANECSVAGPADVELRIRRNSVPGNASAHRISVFLINNAAAPPPETVVPTGSLVFQPQIRVCIADGSRIIALPRQGIGGDAHYGVLDEEASLDLLYWNQPIMARGHLCGAVWRDIDPERNEADGSPSPFSWIDSQIVAASEVGRFRSPDVRTEILPLFPVPAPEFRWRDEYGASPELSPAVLAEMWDPADMTEALQPLPEGYRLWIRGQTISNVPASLQEIGRQHLAQCELVCDRISAGISLLASDDTVRLAFCFANRAIAEQSSWHGSPISWRPFQLAFILMCIEGVAKNDHPDRGICDLLWVATGGGKTEAYLGLIAFTFALRRLKAQKDEAGHRKDTGVAVISRYSLRLLTIQQFRRALNVVTACEVLRVMPTPSGNIGWRPQSCPVQDDYLWGTARFSAGLWVGGGVTPNRMESTGYPQSIPGALDLLRNPGTGQGEPGQVMQCPRCGAHLAIAQPRHERQERPAFPDGHSDHLHFVFYSDQAPRHINPPDISTSQIGVVRVDITSLPAPGFYTLSIQFIAGDGGFSGNDLNTWWRTTVQPILGTWARLESASASRPGYFLREFQTTRNSHRPYDFDVYCPSPECPLAASAWREKVPVPVQSTSAGADWDWQEVAPPFQSAVDPTVGTRIPIPALTVDEQIYAHPPSLLVATVDKFARLAFEPKAASIFGFVTHFHGRHGYYRDGCPAAAGQNPDHPPVPTLSRQVGRFCPPDLILQDELHLIDGPLGSMVGIYETAIDALSEVRIGDQVSRPKYIASTATARQARDQVQALFCRGLTQFPAPGLTANDSFFASTSPAHPKDEGLPGRLYLAVCAPGKGAQTPIVRIWSALLQAVYDLHQQGHSDSDIDPYWTLVGYFNAIRELAGATGLYRQDVPQRIQHTAGGAPRPLGSEPVELSSRCDALQLPALLKSLENSLPRDAEDAVLVTSMFGTGVDVTRLGLMVVHGQPKTTSAYIQATGRVGRSKGGLVVVFLRASRPRDLDHYEFFTGYHSQLYKAVEPVTVAPFSPRARERAIGPICVALLRQAEQLLGHAVQVQWRRDSSTGAMHMATSRTSDDVQALIALLESRAISQPNERRPDPGVAGLETGSELDVWRNLAARHQAAPNLVYQEYSLLQNPSHHVVLGDAQHQLRAFDVAYEDAPQSLRDVESTTGFQI